MNYAGKFDAALSLDGQGFRSPASDHVDSFTVKAHGHVPQGAVVIEDPNLIFHGDFKRTGLDLVLSHDGHEFVVHDYFRGDKRAAIASPDGAHLTGDIVSALTGYVQVAQAAPGAAAAQVIGHVTKLTGGATAIRNGVSVVLNNGDNVEKGDVVSTGSDSTLGITFIDGTVFGLSSNARMVLNEMVYDPNGSNNSSLLSLVAGTITFVAGETAKHGDMKVDTPVATMGIRGTAVLNSISFIIPPGGGDPQPQVNFQVLVEPNGTTGSYILFDKVTLLPIATVNQAGQMIQISGGNVTITNALMSPDVQKLITDVFTLKFSDNGTNTKLTTNFTDSISQIGNIVTVKTSDGTTAQATFTNTVNTGGGAPGQGGGTGVDRIPGSPDARTLDASGNVTKSFATAEHTGATGDRADGTGNPVDPDKVIFRVNFVDPNVGDRPTVSVDLDPTHYAYQDLGHHDVTASLTALQKQDIAATQVKITVVPDGGNNNNGFAIATYSVPDHAFDFLGAGETLTLTYIVSVDNNFSVNPETNSFPITITITGTNDQPVITTSVPTITFAGGTSVPGGPLTSDVPTSGTLAFTDVDLTDTHTVAVSKFSAVLPDGTVPTSIYNFLAGALLVSIASGNDSTGTGAGTVTWSLKDIPVYLADFIPKGEVLTLTYTVTVTDSQGATSDQTVTVTITGTDAPAVVWIATNKPGAPSGGFWKDGANWETGNTPTSNDDVIVITDQLHGLTPSYPVTIDAAAYAKSLSMNDFDTTEGHTVPEVINQSTLTITQTLTLDADSKLTNLKAGTISVGGKAEFSGTSVLSNAGNLQLAGGGDFAKGTSITNSGTIELSGGTLTTLAEIHNAGGTLKVDAGTTLIVSTATVDGGTVSILGTLELDGTSLIENGTLNNSGAVNVKGTTEFANETVGNTALGTIEVFADAVLTIDNGSIINNSGNVVVDANAEMILNGATISGGAVKGDGDIDVTGASTINSGATLSVAAVTADAKLTLDGVTVSGSVITDNASIELDNTVKLQDGAEIKGGPVTNNGTLEISGPATLLNDVVTNHGTVKVDGSQTLTLSGTEISGGAINGPGSIDVTGNSKIDGGATLSTTAVTVEAGTTLTLNTATVDGTTISDKGSITIDNTVKLTGGAVIKGGSSVFAPKGGSPATVEFNWGQLGTSFTVLGSPQQVVATDGSGGTVSSAGGVFERIDQGYGWSGNFAAGTHLLWDYQAGPDITIKFAAPVSSAGAQIQADYYGAFTAEIIAYDLGGNVIGTVSENGVSNGYADGSAIFIDFVSSSANIATIKFLVTSATYLPNDFAVGPVQFSESPSSGASGPIVNNGTLEIEGAATLLNDIVTNHGTVTVDVGQTLTLSGTEISGGSIAGAGTIDVTGESAIDGGATLSTSYVTVESLQALMLDAMTVDGTTITDKGSVEFDDTVTLMGGAKIQGTSAVVKGAVTNNGTLEIADAATLLNDVVTNNGTVRVDDGKVLTLSGTEISGGTINNYSGLLGGTINVTGDSKIDNNAILNNGAVTVASGVTLTFDDATVSASKITNGGTVKVDADKKLTMAGATLTGGALTLAGTLTSSGTTTITDANISNSYLLESTLGGLLTLAATTSTPVITNNGGTIQANGAELDINTEFVTNAGTLAAINDGTLKLISTQVTNAGGAVSIESGSTLDLSDATVTGGTLTISGTLESTGTSAITGADITNTGTISVTSGTLTIDPDVIHTLTNNKLLQANGGELDISGEAIVNTADIKAIGGGVLKLTKLGVTNDGGTVTIDGTSKLYLTAASINGGSLNNSGNVYSVSGSNSVTGAVINAGTIEVQTGTLNLSGGLTGAGSLVIDDKATLELAGATAQTVTFAGGADTLQLDKVAGQSFTGTIAGQSSKDGTFTVTGAADITASSGDALDFTASGGTSAKPANIVLTPSGALKGATGGIVVTQNGTGNISLTATGNITGLAGNGITLRDSASGAGDITIDNVTGIATGTGATSEGILVENLNSANAGDILITQLGGAVGGAFGIDATTQGHGDVTVDAGGNITGSSTYAIRARSYGSGDISVTTETGSVVTSGSSGIIAVNRATSLDALDGSTITVNAHGAINSGSTQNLGGNPPAGIQAGYAGAINGTNANTNVNGSVVVNNYADITAAAGSGIDAYNYGNGDVTVNSFAGTTISVAGTQSFGIVASALSGGTGNIAVTLGANVTISGATVYGIKAYSIDAGDISVTLAKGDSISSSSSGVVAVNGATSIASGDSTITVNAYGTINSGSSLNQNNNTPAGIQAGYSGAHTGTAANTDVNGNVVVNNYADIVSGGHGIHAFNYGNGDVTVNDGAGTSVTGAVAGIKAVALSGGTGDVSVNVGANANVTATSGYGIDAYSLNAGDISVVTSDGDVIKSGSVGIDAVNEAGAIDSDAHSTIFVSAHGTIHSGVINTKSNHTPAGIMAGYTGGGGGFDGSVYGDVTVESDATIITDAGSGIAAFTQGVGTVTVTTGADSTITATGTAINVFDLSGDINITNDGSATGASGVAASGYGAGKITIANDGHITGTSGVGIGVTQALNATGEVHITNDADGHVTGAGSFAAISVQAGSAATVLIDNSGTIGPDDAGSVTSTTYAIVESGGPVTINNTGHINGDISVATATFNNELGGTWTVSGTSLFGTLSTIDNAGEIDLHNGASISTIGGASFSITNSGEIESWGTTWIAGSITNTNTIEVHTDGTLSLYGSLSGSGSVTIDTGATLVVDATVSQTVTFAGDGSELSIKTTDFGGAIAGLAATDKIDLSSIDYSLGTSAVYVANKDASTGGTLTITDAGGLHISLTLTGADYSHTNFAGSDDGTGHTLITVNAADDAPKFTTDGATLAASFSELDSTTNSQTADPLPTATGSIAFTDVDLTDRPGALITHQDVTWLDTDHATQLTLTPDEVYALEHALSLQQTGHNNGTVGWSYSIADSTLDFLAQGQTATVVSTITLDDGHHKTDTTQVSVTIAGANDAPTLDAVTAGTLTDTATTDSFDHLIGQLVGHDVDNGETTTLSYAVLDADNKAETTVAGHYGSLTVNANGTYDYTPDADAINALSAGSYTDTFTVQTTDAHGATGTATFTVNVTGANDTPAITTGATDTDKVALTETNAGFSTTGTLSVADADATDHVTVAVDHLDIYLDGVLQTEWLGEPSNATLLNYLTVPSGDILDGTSNHGQFTWDFNSGSQAFDFLAAGHTLSLQYTIVPNDGHTTGIGDIVTINIAGSNDAPTLDDATLAAVGAHDSNPAGATVSDLFAYKFHDADDGASFHAIAVTSDVATATEGVWQYEVAGTNQWVDIGSVSDTQALVLGTDTLIRFVPADGFNGTPDPLGVHALDDTYTGAITTSASTSTIDIAAMSTDGTAPVSDKAATISTSVTAPAPAPGGELVINTDSFTVAHNGELNTDTIRGLQITDTDSGASTDDFSVTAVTAHEPVDGSPGSTVEPTSLSGELGAINKALFLGVTYNPGDVPPDQDQITLTVTDKTTGASDTVNFIFNEGEASDGVTLNGTSGKDVIFATTTGDTLSGHGGQDQFVFAPGSAGYSETGQLSANYSHAITDFIEGVDKIDLRQFSDVTSINDLTITPQDGGTHVTWQQQIGVGERSVTEHETLLLSKVTANLQASDFIFGSSHIT